MSAQKQENTFDLKIFSRVASYSLVSRVLDTGRHYYALGKGNALVAKAEETLEGGYQWLAPKVEPILNNAKPLLEKADTLACSALDTVENNSQRLLKNYQSTREVLEERVGNVKDATYGALEQVHQRVIDPVDEYLNHSTLAQPLNLALDVTEKLVDKYLPADPEQENEVHGPISKSTHLSRRLQKEAFSKLHNLSLRAPERLHEMAHTVDLIKYAADVLDSGRKAINTTAHNGALVLYEAPKELRERVQATSTKASELLAIALTEISKRIPLQVSERFNEVSARVDSVVHFSALAQSSSKALKEAANGVGEYVSRGEELPKQLLAFTHQNLQKVVDGLASFTKAPAKPE